MVPNIPVHAIWLAQDDPKKNTAVKLSRRDDLVLHERFNRLPRRGIILEPLCGKVLGPEDHSLLLEEGGSLVGLDCSWAQIEDSVNQVMSRTKLKGRMLPLLLAANPVNWGKPGKLSTIEALAAASYLCGNKEQSKELLGGFRWGQRFIELNYEPLEEYSSAKTSQELVELQFEYFDLEHLRSGDE